MFDHVKIKQAFSTLVGLRQNDNPEFGQLSPSLLYNGENVLVQHPLVNIENLEMTARNYSKYQFTAYAPATPYTTGTRVTYSGINYEALQNSTGQQPDTSPAFWKVLNLLDLLLQDVWNNAAEDTVNEVFNKKKISGQSKTLVSSMRFYESVGNYTDLIVNEGDLVGVQVKLLQKNNLLAIIEQVGLQLSAPQTPLNIYVYHSSQVEPIMTLVVNHIKQVSFQWHDAKIKLHYLSKEYDAGGVFFIMYDQAELTGQAVRKKHNFNTPPCGYCDINEVKAYNLYSKYIFMNSVRVKAVDRNQTNPVWLWDIEKTQFTPDTNWGLNFSLTVRCDLTDFLIQQKDVFAYAMRDMVTKKLLELMANTTRQNVGQSKLDVLARNELMATYAGGMGFMKQLEDQLKAVDFEISALDDLCMPCNKKGGLGYGTAGLSNGS